MISRLMIRTLCCCLVTWLIGWSLAPPVAGQSAAPPSRLQALASDTALQFQLAFRHDQVERQLRREQLTAVTESWRGAVRSDANNRLLAEWLRGAIRSSMPGFGAALPLPPAFDGGSTEPRPDIKPATAKHKSVGDPFGDDPVAE